MWFKNLQIYRLTSSFDMDANSFGEALKNSSFIPCRSQEIKSSGWVPPLGRTSGEFVHSTNGYLMICAKRQEKILPSSVINEDLEEKVSEIEERDSRSVPAKEKRQLKEEIVFNLLPKAFARSSLVFAYISPKDNLLVINAASSKRAEELVDDLRKSLGSLPVIPLTTNNKPVDVLSRWVSQGETESGFELGEDCELRDNSDSSCIIRYKNQNLKTAEIVNYLKTGMHVSKLALTWKDRIECVIDEDLGIKRLRFSDLVQEQADEIEADDAAMRFDVDFSIMALELTAFFKALVNAFGGEDLTSKQQP